MPIIGTYSGLIDILEYKVRGGGKGKREDENIELWRKERQRKEVKEVDVDERGAEEA